MTQQYTIIHYEENGRDIFKDWVKSLKDFKGRDAINRTVSKLLDGNFGDHKFCRDDVWELRIHVGAGYRVYYSVFGDRISQATKSFYCFAAVQKTLRKKILIKQLDF